MTAWQRRKFALVTLGLAKLQKALEQGDAPGDERIMRAMTELVTWRKEQEAAGARDQHRAGQG